MNDAQTTNLLARLSIVIQELELANNLKILELSQRSKINLEELGVSQERLELLKKVATKSNSSTGIWTHI